MDARADELLKAYLTILNQHSGFVNVEPVKRFLFVFAALSLTAERIFHVRSSETKPIIN